MTKYINKEELGANTSSKLQLFFLHQRPILRLMTPADLMRAIIHNQIILEREVSKANGFLSSYIVLLQIFFMLFDTNNDGVISFAEGSKQQNRGISTTYHGKQANNMESKQTPWRRRMAASGTEVWRKRSVQ
ncbi:hypothetical protein HYC85_003618 [Camellia sinensis]|uniref:EF-hand domain-containing protein n=1 Tax=Camellia sinensis TaxID=4442 RepID=A0A7J7HU68_CAMSI|nr:hypothetical protein HYC85_003618 [Camellia sinensis]